VPSRLRGGLGAARLQLLDAFFIDSHCRRILQANMTPSLPAWAGEMVRIKGST